MAAFKRGLIAGFAAGYVLGSKAGRERYDQIMRAWMRIKQTPGYQRAAEKVGAAVGLGLERGKVVAIDQVERVSHKVKDKLAHNGSGTKL